MLGRCRRYLVLGLLGLWLAPSAGALAVGLHLALDHDHESGHHGGHGGHGSHGGHGGHGGDDSDGSGHASVTLDELVLAVVHGHHHKVDAPPHEHPAHLEAVAGVARSPSQALCFPTVLGLAPDVRHCEPAASCDRRSPPVPLIYAYCALLL